MTEENKTLLRKATSLGKNNYEKPEPVHIVQPLKKPPAAGGQGSSDDFETRVTCS